MTPSVSPIALFHREGKLALPTLRSFFSACDTAQRQGHKLFPVFVLDDADPATTQIVTKAAGDVNVITSRFADQGLARNLAIAGAQGDHVALLDGDDLWTSDWLVKGLRFLQSCDQPLSTVAHPEFNWIFGREDALVRQPDQTSPQFDGDAMRFANPWDALCIAPRRIYLDTPFPARDRRAGWGYEDWAWNRHTTDKGIVHRIVPGTVVFKRRRSGGSSAADRNDLMLPVGTDIRRKPV